MNRIFKLIWVLAVSTAVLVRASAAEETKMIEHTAVVPNREPLEKTPFIHLPIGTVKAEGWLLRQLQLQKAGLTGSAEQIYDALTPNSGWLGGKGDGWEKSPYYVKGLVALANVLDDAELKQRAKKWVDWTLQSQKEDGSFGPASNDDWWPRMVVLFYLRDHYEATGDARVIPFLTKYFQYQLATMPRRPMVDWGKARAGDNMDVVLWTYNITGDASLLDLAKVLYDQAYPWTSIFTDNLFYTNYHGDDFYPHHIVNVSQAFKFSPVAWQFTHNQADKNAFAAGVANLEKQYGRIDGQVSGTEMLSGLKSTDGVELCADIERIISNGIAVDILGDPAIADQMEKVAYNSLPAHTTPNMRQITYYQLPNQVACTFGGHGFTQDYGNANMPGPHSGFPCCCYNWHAGWPKFVAEMWSATSDGGLAAIAYGPNKVTTTVAGGMPITITQTTDYPFAETVSLKVEPKSAVKFPLVLRIPGWCKSPEIKVNGEAELLIKLGSFHRIDREWKPGDRVELKFPMEVRASTWINNSVGLERGPLAFALKIKEQWEMVHPYPNNFNEFAIQPRSPWNYALQIDRSSPVVKVSTKAVPQVPFETDGAPVTLSIQAKKMPSWIMRTMQGTVSFGRSDGGWHPQGEASTTLEPKVSHHVRVIAKGKSIQVFVDDMDKAIIDREDDAFSSGAIGLRTYDTSAKFDDIRIDGKTVEDFSHPGAEKWKTISGQWGVRNGQYVGGKAKDGKTVFTGMNDLSDFTLDATVTLDGGGNAGLMFRVTDPSEKVDGYHGYYVGLAARASMSEDAQEPPTSPVTSDEPTETVELIPFGSSKLRVSYFPVLEGK